MPTGRRDNTLFPALFSTSALSRSLVTKLEQSRDASRDNEHERNAETSLGEEGKKSGERMLSEGDRERSFSLGLSLFSLSLTPLLHLLLSPFPFFDLDLSQLHPLPLSLLSLPFFS